MLNPRNESNKLKYEGKVFSTKNNGDLVVIEYKRRDRVVVKFIDTGYVKTTHLNLILEGKVKDRLKPTIYGVGVVKERPKTKLEQVSYDTWGSMLKRCYENKVGARNRTYASCFVAPNLLDFNVFNTWCLTQVGFNNYDEKGRRFVLDKDILVKGNKIYSEDTCCFVPAEINTLILKSEAIRGEYPIGVHKRGSRFCGRCKVNNKDRFLGYTDTAEEAFYKYKKFKEQHIKDMANKWKDQIDPRVYEALMNYTVEITD